MNKKILIVILLSISLLFFVSCKDKEEPPKVLNEYTVTWKNYNGEVLKIDENVLHGTVPNYEGTTPFKESDENYSYSFIGWTPEINEVVADITYTATFLETINTYTITWKNYNGDVLDTETDVPFGTIPTYNGPTPKRDADNETIYLFNGWSPSISEVKKDMTYNATYIEKSKEDDILGVDPIISSDHKTVQYGFYPQSHVSDLELINELNKLTEIKINDWVLFEDSYYTKIIAKTYNNEEYVFNDGTAIINNNEYWFKCEPITWNILKDDNDLYYLLSTMILDAKPFYQDYNERTINDHLIYANNYEHSYIREWLNNDFYETAFNLNNTYIKEITIDNSAITSDSSDNIYSSNNTLDKVSLPSYQDYLNSSYNFDSNNNTSTTRVSKTTDYARANGAWSNTTDNLLNYNGSYWTRSASSQYYYVAWNVNSGGYLSEYAVDGKSHGVRPSITINIIK